jgi:hypothetical protein
MHQHSYQLNTANMAVQKYDCIFVSPFVKNISFSCDYLKQFHIEKN